MNSALLFQATHVKEKIYMSPCIFDLYLFLNISYLVLSFNVDELQETRTTASKQLQAQAMSAQYIEGNRLKSNYGGPKRQTGLVFGAANQKLLCHASAYVFVAVSRYKACTLRRGCTAEYQTNERS